MGRILHMARKEFIQVFRDKRLIAILFVAPILQLFLFGYAVTTDVRNTKVAVADYDDTAASRDLIASLFSTTYFAPAGLLTGDEEITGALVHGRANVVLVIPHGFERDLRRGDTADLQVLLDGSDSNSSTVAAGYLGRIVVAQSQDLLAARMNQLTAHLGHAAGIPTVETETRFRFNPELKSAWYMVPGVLGMILLVITMIMTSLALTREREVGTMEQLVVTPIKPWQLLAGKMLPFAIIGMVDITLILTVAVGHFGLPVVGSLALLYFAAAVFLFTTLGMGLLLSTLSHTQQQAMFLGFLIMMPAILLSGFMFPIANMPVAAQWITYANPLRYFLAIVRAIVLKGNGWAVLAPDFGMLFALGVILFALASLRFNKTVS